VSSGAMVAGAFSMLPIGGVIVLLNVAFPSVGWGLAILGSCIFGAGIATLLTISVIVYARRVHTERGRFRQ